MNDSDRENLVDYVLGRLTDSESAALESRALADPDLARRLRDLWRELESRPNVLPVDGARQRDFLRRLDSLGILDSNAPLQTETIESSAISDASAPTSAPEISESPAASEQQPNDPPKKRRKRFLFIPKRVSAPALNREEESALVFKRAVELTPEEQERRQAVARRARAAAGRGFVRRSVFSLEPVDYRFVDDLPRLAASLVATRRFRPEPVRTVVVPFDFASYESAFEAERPRFDESYLVEPVAFDASPRYSVAAAPALADFAFAPGRLAAPSALRVDCPQERAEAFRVDVAAYAAYLARPLVYTRNGVRFVDFFTPYPFENFDEAPAASSAPRLAPEGARLRLGVRPVEQERDILPVASQELIDLISAAIGQSPTYIQQNGAAYVSAKPDADDDEALVGETFSAENLRLAELLGRSPTAIDLEEYYWEDVDAEEDETEYAIERGDGLLMKLFYLATTPSVLVGRATIRVFRAIFPRDLERDEASRETRRQKDEGAGGISDMLISLVAGILIAACVVFPLLHKVVREVYDVIAESAVREYGGRVPIPTGEAVDLDVTDMMLIDQILHPSYESMEINESGDYESDGLPMNFN